MSATPEPSNEPPSFRGAFKEWLKDHLPFGLKVFVPWFQSEWRGVQQGWFFFLFISSILLTATVWMVWKTSVIPVEEKLKASEKAKNDLEQQLAPFWAASGQRFPGMPSTERLEALLNVITNNSADLKELKEFQSRKAELEISVVGEGAGLDHFSGPLQPFSIIYIPLFGGATKVGLHFSILNRGNLPAETIQASFFCPTQQNYSAPGWRFASRDTPMPGYDTVLFGNDVIHPFDRVTINP